MLFKLPRQLFLALPICVAFIAAAPVAMATGAATKTTLQVSAGGSVVTTVSSGTVVTLTASVVAGTTPVTAGQVNFCDATAVYCEDIHILASVNLSGTGSASYKFRPGPGVHSYKAVFLPSPTDATSTSAPVPLTVTAPTVYPTVAGIAATGSVGNYTLTAMVGSNGPAAPSGSVSFLDTTDGNDLIGTENLEANATGISYIALEQSLIPTAVPTSVIAADFNNDGIPDFVVLNEGYNGNSTLSVFLGNGDGTFTSTGVTLAAGTVEEQGQIAAGDFNGDGIPDLVVIENNSNTTNQARVFIGDGTGKFTALTPFSISGGAPFAVIDFNGDGILDLAFTTGTNVGILLGQGNGTFTPLTQTTPNSFRIGGMAVADFNGDGLPDIALTGVYDGSNDGSIQVLFGNGDGTFTVAPAATSAGECFGPPAVADFNGDGITDIALPCRLVPNLVQVFLGSGTGTFTASGTAPGGYELREVKVADFNGDGIPDLAAINFGDFSANEPNAVTISFGTGEGTFTATTAGPVMPAAYFASDFAAADFNGDGTTDMVLVEWAAGTGGIIPYQHGFPNSFIGVNQTATASITGVAALPAGSGVHQDVASYAGNTGNAASTSSPTPVLAVQGTPTFNIAFSSNPSQYLAPVTITVTVSGTGLTPTGQVTFYDGTTVLTSGNLNASGVASYTSSAFANGTHSITVDYSGDSNYFKSNSAASTLTIDGGATSSVAVSSSNPSIAYGLSLTLTAKVAGGGVTPTGTVTFFDGSTQLGLGTLNSSGSASYVTSSLSIGSHSITAKYGGDSAYGPSTSPVFTQTVTPPITPTVTVTPSATTISTKQALTVKVVVTGTSGNPTPTGIVSLSGGSFSGQAELSSGAATFSIAAGTLTTGTDMLTAAYTGVTPYANASGTTTVTVYNPATAATITSPTPGSVFMGTSVTFNWTTAAGATGYYLWIGSTGVGSSNIYYSAEKTVTSYTFNGMPANGEAIYVRLITNFSGNWVSNDYTYTANRRPAVITSPAPGSVFAGSSVAFTWSAPAGATGYYLWIGSSGVGSNNIYNSAEKTVTSYTFTQMPVNGEKIYVRLNTTYNGNWVSVDYVYTAFQEAAAVITSPAPGGIFTGSSVTFDWTAASGATGYYLWIGSTGVGSNNIYNSAEKTVTSYTFTQMPTNGEKIYVRLNTNYNGTWLKNDYTYTAYLPKAAITSPAQGTTFTGSSVTFTWTAASGATGYYLWIGSTGVGSNNIYNSAEKTVTSYTFPYMPTNGETIYVRLYTNYNGSWVGNDYTYKAAP